MNHADIKEGKYYNLELQCILNREKVIVFETASGDHIPIRLCDLECVHPVEEPYSVRHNDAHAAYSIYGPYGLSAANYFYGDRYPYSKHSAEAAAYAECDRLNAAYRKEQENV